MGSRIDLARVPWQVLMGSPDDSPRPDATHFFMDGLSSSSASLEEDESPQDEEASNEEQTLTLKDQIACLTRWIDTYYSGMFEVIGTGRYPNPLM